MNQTKGNKILTLPHPCLTKKASAIDITPSGLAIAHETINSLMKTLQPRMPAAGLAAPQIGISQRIMIFSWDRSLENLESAINPSYRPLDMEQQVGWEGCFSVPLVLVAVSRYQNIIATYTKPSGHQVSYILRGFAARVFQHETDHMDGIETIHKQGVKIQHFDNHADLIAFLNEVRKGDQAHYIAPEMVDYES